MRLQAGIRVVIALAIALIGITIAPVAAVAAGGTISGTVYTQFGQFAGGAEVLVDGQVVTTTGADGTFQTPPLAAGTRQVQARLAGNAPTPVIEVLVSDDTDHVVFLVLGYPLGTISGTVTDADGVPFDGAEITVDGVVVGLSGPSGAFTIADVEGGNRRISATAAGYSQPSEQWVFLIAEVTDIIVSVGWRDGTVSGTVTDANGTAISGATVLLDAVEVATSGADGGFSTGVVGGGFRTLTATAEGYTSDGPTAVLVSGATTGVTVSAGFAGGTISGVVQDSAGQSVAGAEILVDAVPVAISAGDGSFTSAPVQGGSRQVSATAPGFSIGWPTSVVVSGDVGGAVVVLGPRDGTISGFVRDELDQPVAGATVFVDWVPVGTSGPDGAFTTEVVTGGFRSVSASVPGTFTGWPVDAFVDGDVGGVQVQIGRPAAFVTGVITDPDGTPLPGIEYRANWGGGAGVTGDDGVFALTFEPGDYQLVFTDPTWRFRPRTFEFESFTTGTTLRDVTLQPRIENVIGTVTDASGNPVAGATVVVNGLSTSPPTTVTDADGRFALVEVPVWPSYWITVTPPFGSGLVRYTQSLAVVDPDEIIELDITMDAAARIEISVTADGDPAVARALLVAVDRPFGLPAASGSTDESGRIVLSDLQPGRYVIELENGMPGFASEYFPDAWYFGNALVLDVAAGDVLRFDADLERSAVITGVVIGPDGLPEPDSGAIVQAEGSRPDLGPAAGFPCNDVADGDPPGTYRKACLHPSAEYIVSIGERQGVSAAQYYDGAATPDDATPVTVTEGGTTSGIDFRLAPVAPPVELLGLSRQFFRAGTTTTGVRLYGDNFPSDPDVLVAEVQRAGFDDVVVDIDVTSVVSPRIAVVSVTVSDGSAAPGPRSLFLGRVGSFARDFCDTCLYLGSASTEVGAMSGRVTTATGAPIPLAQVIVTGPNLVPRRIIAGPDGRWLATGLSPGQHRVTFLGTARWAGEHWRDTSRVASARTVTITTNRLRRGIDATLSRRPAVAVTSVSPSVVDNGFTRLVLRGSGLAPIEGGFTVEIQRDDGVVVLRGPATYRSGSSLAVEAWLSGGTYDVIIRWTGRSGTTREQRCEDCITVRPPSFPF